MVHLDSVSVGEFVSTVRDIGFFIGLCVIGWKARGLVQPGIELYKRAIKFFDGFEERYSTAQDFFNRSETHYLTMERQMDLLLNNHLSHLANDKKDSETQEIL